MEGKKCYLFIDGKLLLKSVNEDVAVPVDGDFQPDYLKSWMCQAIRPYAGADEVLTASLLPEQKPAGDGWVLTGLRDSYSVIPECEYAVAGKLWQIMYWDEHSRFCPKCGKPMQRHTDIMKRCPGCGFEMYPVVSPAVIVRISRGDEILLVHARNFRGRFYGLVAGFVESGESLEQCVCREVMEETGLTIGNIRYFGSQTWPYPSNLMVGFTADYVSGEIKLQDEELSAGAFYGKENLPELPRRPSIARKLIDSWLESYGK